MRTYQLDDLNLIEQQPHGAVPAYLRAEATQGAWRFHHTLTDYAPTPLRALQRSWAWGRFSSRTNPIASA